MSDLATLIQTLELHLPAIRQEMAPADWAAFKALLAEAAPVFEQAAADPDARLEALYLLERAFGRFQVTRRILPPPGGAWAPTSPPPPPEGQLPQAPLAQKEPDLDELLRRAAAICRDPNAAADRAEAASRTETD
jgi:hypothetical protein